MEQGSMNLDKNIKNTENQNKIFLFEAIYLGNWALISDKRIKQTCNPLFWGDVGIKSGLGFFVSASEVPFFGT